MRRLLPLAFALALPPTIGHAAFSLTDVDITCSDALTVQEGSALSYACTGNLSLSGTGTQSSIQADDSITLSATGNLSLTDLTLTSHSISLITQGGSISLLGDVAVMSDAGQNVIPIFQGFPGSAAISIGTPSAPPITNPYPVIIQDAGTVLISPDAGISLGSVGAVQAVPEPTTSAMLAVGLTMLLAAGSRRQQR
jgi:hypothetical protein